MKFSIRYNCLTDLYSIHNKLSADKGQFPKEPYFRSLLGTSILSSYDSQLSEMHVVGSYALPKIDNLGLQSIPQVLDRVIQFKA